MAFPTVTGLPTAAKTEHHLACSDPVCPTSIDPHTGRVTCRCYQMTELRDQAPNPQIFTSSGYPGIFPTSYSMEAQSAVTSPLQSNPGLGPYTNPMMNNVYQPPQFIPQGTTMPQLDNILRSQVYNYMYPGVLDVNSLARRKNATRETTSALKAWLQQHKKNPYPTKAEKIMLAIVTKMTLTQVSTWFANARRRLKKENKGEWSSDNSLENVSDTENDDRENDDLNKQNLSLNLSGFSERHPMLHSTPIPNRVPEIPKDHAINAPVPEGLPRFSTFSSFTPFSAGQHQKCSMSPPIGHLVSPPIGHIASPPIGHTMSTSIGQTVLQSLGQTVSPSVGQTTQCSTVPSLHQNIPPLTSAHHLTYPYSLCQGMKYDNQIYSQTFPRATQLDSEGDSNQNYSASSSSSLDESDKENVHISGNSQPSNICVSAMEKKSVKQVTNTMNSKPKIWSITEIISPSSCVPLAVEQINNINTESSSYSTDTENKENVV